MVVVLTGEAVGRTDGAEDVGDRLVGVWVGVRLVGDEVGAAFVERLHNFVTPAKMTPVPGLMQL